VADALANLRAVNPEALPLEIVERDILLVRMRAGDDPTLGYGVKHVLPA
jgi:hypothetical protein